MKYLKNEYLKQGIILITMMLYKSINTCEFSKCLLMEKSRRARKTYHPCPLDVKDINNYMIFKTKRVTNPLSPRYVYDVPPHLKFV